MTPPSTTHGAHPTIGFIGAGNMARSLASGLLKNGWNKARIMLSDPDPSQRHGLPTTPGGLAVVRAVPNTAALSGGGASGLFANERTNEVMRNQAESILRAVGVTVWLPRRNPHALGKRFF